MLRRFRLYLHWGVVGALALLTLVLGMVGWGIEDACRTALRDSPPPVGCSLLALAWPDQWLTAIYHTLLLFPGQTVGVEIWPQNTALQIARILGPVTAYAALLRLIGEFMASRIEAWLIRRMKNHVVICGLGARGRAFALDRRDRKNGRVSVVAIEREANEAVRTFCETHRIHLVEGDCRDVAILRRAAVATARAIIVVTGHDNDNLAIARLSRDLLHEAGDTPAALTAYVAINHPPLWRELAESDLIDRRDRRFHLEPFSLPVLAARALLWDEPLYTYADMMDQRRVHAVLVGFDAYGESLLTQIARICHYKDFDRPAITILAAEAPLAEGTLRQHLPGAREAADIDIVQFDPSRDPLDGERLGRIVGNAGITAVFICLNDDDEALQTALYVQKVLQRAGRATAPIYVRLSQRDGAEGILVSARAARRFGDIVAAFGTIDQLCRLDLIEGDLEQHAVAVHEDYLSTRKLKLGGGYDPTRAESAQDWSALRETYREANRRAADHIKAKIASVGAWQPPGTKLRVSKQFSLLAHPQALDSLAELEHRSWCAGAHLDGWRFGHERDNRRKYHNNLVPYADLDPDAQEYDKDQILGLQRRLCERHVVDDPNAADLVRDDIWIGLIGRNHVTTEDDRWVAEAFEREVLAKLLERYPDHFVTLVSPLAPGLDLTLTRRALKVLGARRRPRRLLVVEGVPESQMIEDFLRNDAGVRAGPWAAALDGHDTSDVATLFKRIAEERRAIIWSDATERVIDLTSPGACDRAEPQARETGYGRAGAYIADKCAVLVAAVEPDAPIRRGGTAETLERRCKGTAASSTWPVGPARQTVLLDPEKHVVSS